MTQRAPELLVPAITPFAADLSVDTGAFLAHARRLLAAGAHGLAPFGTTSEANSLTVAERRAALEALVRGESSRAGSCPARDAARRGTRPSCRATPRPSAAAAR